MQKSDRFMTPGRLKGAGEAGRVDKAATGRVPARGASDDFDVSTTRTKQWQKKPRPSKMVAVCLSGMDKTA